MSTEKITISIDTTDAPRQLADLLEKIEKRREPKLIDLRAIGFALCATFLISFGIHAWRDSPFAFLDLVVLCIWANVIGSGE